MWHAPSLIRPLSQERHSTSHEMHQSTKITAEDLHRHVPKCIVKCSADFCLVMRAGWEHHAQEYVERTLTQDLRKFNRGFPPLLVKMVTWQLLQAVSFLHRNRVRF